MPDREKVLKDIDCEEYSKCPECPYVKFGKCKVLLMRDAKELLKKQQEEIQNLRKENHSILTQFHEWAKEQKAVEPILKRKGRSKAFNDYVCPVCDQEIAYEQNYCSECGKPILWKGGEQE